MEVKKRKVGRPAKTLRELSKNEENKPVLYCASCENYKTLSNFSKERRSALGYQTKCKLCEKEYRTDNKEQIKKYFEDHKREIAEGKVLYYEKHREKIKTWRRNYYASDGKIKVKVANQEYRSRKMSTSDGTVTEDFIELMYYAQDGKCALCEKAFDGNNREFHIDHIIPLSKKGVHTANNIQLLCQKCNCSKQDKIADSFFPTTEYNQEYVISTMLNLMIEGASIEEVIGALCICKDTFYRWVEKYAKLSDAKKKAEEFSAAWWLKHGRTTLFDSRFNHVLYYMNMKNRFKWCDKHEIEHSGNLILDYGHRKK